MSTLWITAENRSQYENTAVFFDGHIWIEAKLGWLKFVSIKATASIIALTGSGIEAGEGIEAGSGIKAGEGIKAGWGIEAKFISVKLRILAGLIMWRLPKPEDLEIRAKIKSGTVALGVVVDQTNKETT